MPYRFPETDTPVRVATIDGEPWFVVADVCKVLGIGNPSDAARRLNEGDLDTIEVTDSSAGARTPTPPTSPGCTT
ncbi:Bro-N domain-containing protein [Kitasatospora aburaviensis]